MKKLLVDTILFDVTPKQLHESIKENDGKVIVSGVLQRAEAKNQNGRVYPKEILIREVKKYQQHQIKERRALGELDHPDCERSSAEILTQSGWKLIKDVQVGEMIPSLNETTNTIEYQPVQRVINEPYKGKMISIVGKNIDTMVTPNHRFYLKDRNNKFVVKTAQELYEMTKTHQSTHLSIPIADNEWVGTHYDTFVLDGILDIANNQSPEYKERAMSKLVLNAKSFFGFLGFYLAEGHCTNREDGQSGYGVFITQNIGETSDKFRELITNLSSELKWNECKKGETAITFSCHDPRLWSYVSKLGNKYMKYIPDDIKSASSELLQELFSWYLQGDGTTVTYNGYTNHSIFSVSKKLMEDFQEVLLKLGVASVIKEQISKKDYVYAGRVIEVSNKSTLYRLKLKKSTSVHLDFRFIKINEVEYDDTVHCVTVENGNFYCRDKGFPHWTGNSSVINLRNVSHNVLECYWKGNDVVGKVEILPTPSGNILKNLLGAGIRLGISSRGLGSVKEINENTVEVQDDFELIGWDFVSNPSTHGAFMYPAGGGEVVPEGVIKEGVSLKKISKVDPKIKRMHGNITNIICEIGNYCDCIFEGDK